MVPRPLLIAPAAAGVYAALLVATGPVQPSPARGAEVSGALDGTSAEVPSGPPVEDLLPTAPEPERSPEPLPSPPETTPEPPEPRAPVAEAVAPVPDAPAPEDPADAKPGGGAGAPATPGGSESAESPGLLPPAEAPPRRWRLRTERARKRPNTKLRTDGVLRSSPSERRRLEQGKTAPRGGLTPAGSGPAVSIPAQWLSGYVAADPVAVPDAVIDGFGIPPFLLPIYRAAGLRYGVPWEILAAINEIETGYGRNLNVSSAGAVGWMQFMPSTWDAYGVDADDDGRRDPFSPVDAIFAAARYLSAAGADTDMRKAIYAYNHADWYVESVLERAEAIARLPRALVDSLAGLAGGRFPVRGEATYAVDRRGAERALPAMGERRGIAIFAPGGAPVIAVNEGRVVRVGYSARLGRYLALRDVYGNTYTYARLGQIGGVRETVRRGAHVDAGARLGRLARRSAASRPHLRFRIRPAGHGAPRIDPKPILDGWAALDSGALPDAERGGPQRTLARIGLMTADTLARRVLADTRIEIYGCGRDDIRSGRVDHRVLATLEFLAASGLAPTVTSLRCGHGLLTASGNISEHSTGSAVDISAINGTPIAGHQGPGSVTEATIQSLLTLQGTMKPHQIISLMTFAGADNTFAMGDHADHIHVGFREGAVAGPLAASHTAAVLHPQQWTRLIDRIARRR